FIRMRIATLVGAFAVGAAAMSAAAPPAEESWRLWGGPRRDFIVPATDLFPKTGEKWLATPPRKLWERPLGDGYSGIAVEDGILYTGYRKGDQDLIVALEAASGKTVWEYAYAAPFKNAYAAGVGPGPYAMPQIVGDRLVTAS